MSKQNDLFEEPEEELSARDKRDEAMRRADDHADPLWKESVTAIIHRLALSCEDFTTDDVWACQPGAPHEPRALGPLMRSAAARGWIETTDRTRESKRPACNARPVRVWRSKLRDEAC